MTLPTIWPEKNTTPFTAQKARPIPFNSKWKQPPTKSQNDWLIQKVSKKKRKSNNQLNKVLEMPSKITQFRLKQGTRWRPLIIQNLFNLLISKIKANWLNSSLNIIILMTSIIMEMTWFSIWSMRKQMIKDLILLQILSNINMEARFQLVTPKAWRESMTIKKIFNGKIHLEMKS